MKKSLYVVLPVFVLFILFTAFQSENYSTDYTISGDKITIPEDVSKIFENSCFGCHNSDSKNDDGKKELMIDKLAGLSASKLVAKLGEINEVVKEKDMPPSKFLEKYPEKALSEDDAKRLIEWADATAEDLMK